MAGGGLPTSVAENQGVTGAPATSPSGTTFANTPLTTNFSESAYLSDNPDVADAVRRGYVTSGLQHYLSYGQGEGRAPAPGVPGGQAVDYLNRPFNDQQYLALNPDVAQVIANRQFTGTGREHYLTSGQSEGRAPSAVANRGSSITSPSYYNTNPVGVDYANIFGAPLFDRAAYLNQNPDVAAAGVDPYQHYLDYGRSEGRIAPTTLRTVTFAQPTLTPQQQANYLSEWQADYSNQLQRGVADARAQRAAAAQKSQSDYNTKKATAEAQATAANQAAINQAVQEALAQQQQGFYTAPFNPDAYQGAGKSGGIASLMKGFKK